MADSRLRSQQVINPYGKVIHRYARMWPEKVRSSDMPAPGHCGKHGVP